jgi:hypothetical protein
MPRQEENEVEETTFFEHDGVRITNTRFVVDGQTFAMSNITSVKPVEKRPSRVLPIVLIVLGALPAVAGAYFGLVLSAIGVAWLALQKTVYHVMLHTAGGETSALKTYQEDYLQSVVAALNDAIVHRG